MRKCLLIFALLPFYAIAQCDSTFKEKVDKFNGSKNAESELALVKNNDIELAWSVSIEENDYIKQALQISFISVSSQSCTKDDAKITLLFEDKSTMELANVFKFNCNGIFGIQFNTKGYGSKAMIAQAKKLEKQKITAIRLRLMSSVFDYDFTTDQQEELQEVIKCAVSKIGI